jgi:UDPglucose 6-dehydrogenase
MKAARELIPSTVDFADSAYEVAVDADALVLVTEWNEFRSLDLDRLKVSMKSAVLVDLRNVYRHDEVARHGFAYTSIGRPAGGSAQSVAEAAE